MITYFDLYLENNPISQMPPLVQVNVLKALEDGLSIAQDKARTDYLTGPRPTKLGVVSGLLKRAVTSKVIKGTGDTFAIGLLGIYDLVYSKIHELGGHIEDHIIAAKNVPYLIFFWKKRGIWMKIKKVHHPADIPARPYLYPALVDSQVEIVNLIDLAIKNAYNLNEE